VDSGILFGLLAMASWGLSDFFVVRPVREAGVARSFLWNQLTGLPIMAGAFLLLGTASAVGPDSAALIIAAGACGILGSLAFYRGMEVGKVSVVTPIVAAWSVVTAIGGVAILGESLSALQTAGIILAVCGTALVSVKLSDIRSSAAGELARGVEFAAVAMAFYGLQFIFLDMLSQRMDFLEALALTKGFVVVASFAIVPRFARGAASFPAKVFPAVAMIALFEVLGFVAYGAGIAVEQSSIVAPVSATHPLATILLAFVVLRERLEPNQALGILSVVGGLVLLSS
jgi:drug/metabolite transporter (DMT)-like permease